MYLFCPACDAAYTGATQCPQCGGRLITPAEAYVLPYSPSSYPSATPNPSALYRIGIGLFVGLGIMIVGLDVVSGWVAMIGPSHWNWWSSTFGVNVAAAIRILAAAIAGLLAGAGRSNGPLTGFLVGALLALIAHGICAQTMQLNNANEIIISATIIVVAAATGMIGSHRWPCPEELPPVARRSTVVSTLDNFATQYERSAATQKPPLRWFRILVCSSLLVLGITYADEIRHGIRVLTKGVGQFGNPATEGLIDLGIAIVVIIFAGFMSGAGSVVGGRHGVITGMLATLGVYAYVIPQDDAGLRPIRTLIEVFDEPGANLYSGQSAMIIAGLIVGMTTLAGWIGGELLPPLAPKSKHLNQTI